MQLLQSEPALFPYTTRLATGLDPLNDPHSSALTELEALYFAGPASYAAGIHGTNALDKSLDAHSLSLLSYSESDSVVAMGEKLVNLVSRAIGRTHEIERIQSAVLSRSEFSEPLHNGTADYNMVISPSPATASCTVYLTCSMAFNSFAHAATYTEFLSFTDRT